MIKRQQYLEKMREQYDKKDTILFLIWARQVGKTTLLHMFVEEYWSEEKTVFLEWDALMQYPFRDWKDFLQFLTRDRDITMIDCLIIDEAQSITNIGLILKNLIDMVRKGMISCKIIVSWSGSLQIFRGMTDSLIGRKYILPVYPCSFEEFLQIKWVNKFVPELIFLHEYEQYFQEYILYWWYPKVLMTTDKNEKQALFLQLINDYLYKDVALLLQSSEIMNFRRLLSVLASKTWSMIKRDSLATETGISRYTLEKYFFVLENTFLIHQVSPFQWWKSSHEIKKMNKWYFHDLGMLRYLSQVQDRVGDFKGKIGENFIANELLYRKTEQMKLHFRALTSWGEIDFIIRNEFTGMITPIEVKTSDNASPSRSYKHFLEVYNNRIDQAWFTSVTQSWEESVGERVVQKTPWLYTALEVFGEKRLALL
jgi:uncharacterized protein